MKTRELKDSIYEQLARIGKAVSAPKRLELLDLLCQGPRTVESLAEQSSMSVANASQHLRVLLSCCLVRTEKKGLYVEYQLADDEVGNFYLSLRRLGESHLAEIKKTLDAYWNARESMESLGTDELLSRARRGEVTLLDVRPSEEYRAAHPLGSVSIPVDELESRLNELPVGFPIVAYCRGPFCVMAFEAVTLLRSRGFAAHRLDCGVVELREHGWAIEVGGTLS